MVAIAVGSVFIAMGIAMFAFAYNIEVVSFTQPEELYESYQTLKDSFNNYAWSSILLGSIILISGVGIFAQRIYYLE